MGGKDTVMSVGVSLGSRGCWGGQGGEERGEESRGEVAGETLIPEKGRIFAEAKRYAGMVWF